MSAAGGCGAGTRCGGGSCLRLLGLTARRSNAGSPPGGEQGHPGRGAVPFGRGAGRRTLPEPAPLRSVWSAAPTQGLAAAAPDLTIRGRGGAGIPRDLGSPDRALPLNLAINDLRVRLL